jgi:hypothetical protein
MIIAELKGKIPSKFDDKEDILTSNVFSFFKYSDRQIFKDYLSLLGIDITLKDSENAEFIFWPIYDDGTEPDLIVICGKYYLLFEAKLYSDFLPKTAKTDSQIEREIAMGKLSAKNLNKIFVYIALTAEYFKIRNKYEKYESDDFLFIWTNWQFISYFINKKLESNKLQHDKEFANDLFLLFIKKRLRSFEGIINITIQNEIEFSDNIFYDLNTSKFKGEFSGFIENLKDFKIILSFQKYYHKSFFTSLMSFKNFNNQRVFYKGI